MTSRWFAAATLAMAVACGGSREKTPAANQSATASPAETPGLKARPTSDVRPQPAPAKAAAPDPLVTPVNFERLSAFLPEFPGWTRGLVRGENVSVGIETSKAEAQYQLANRVIDLGIIDSGMNPIVLVPQTMFMGPGYSERFDEGYRKAITIAGSPAYETWDGNWQRAEVAVVVGKRFIVQASGQGVDNADVVRALVTAVNLSSLATVK